MKNLHISFAKTEYKCPYCNKKNDDIDDKLLDKCNKNKSNCTKVKCDCGKIFGFTYNIEGNAVAFKLGNIK